MLFAALCVATALALPPAPPERPDKIVYTSIYAPDPKNAWVCIMNADGSNRTPLSKEGSIEIDPALSPDGQRIAFVAVSKDDSKGDVWVMAADGSGRKQLT
jgi:Tol biopolymer transport system component